MYVSISLCICAVFVSLFIKSGNYYLTKFKINWKYITCSCVANIKISFYRNSIWPTTYCYTTAQARDLRSNVFCYKITLKINKPLYTNGMYKIVFVRIDS